MPISTINRVKSIAVPLNTASGSNVIPLIESSNLATGTELLEGYKVVSYNCFIKNLKAFAAIKSLGQAQLPDFKQEDSETDKLKKTLDIEWQSPRKQLNCYVSVGNNWLKVGATSLLNPSGYTFRVYNLMDFYTDNLALELGGNGRIAVSIEDVGYQLLESTDVVTIHGSYVEEIFVQFQELIYIPAPGNNPTPNTPSPVDDEMASYLIKTANYTAAAKDRIVFATSDSTLQLTMPSLPSPGDYVSVIRLGVYAVEVVFAGKKYKSTSDVTAALTQTHQEVAFIYIDDSIGWIPNAAVGDNIQEPAT